MDKRLLILAGLAVASGLLAALVIRPPDAGPPLEELNERASQRATSLTRASTSSSPEHAPKLVDSPPAPKPVRPRAPNPSADTDVILALGMPQRTLEAPEVDLAEQRSQQIQRSVLNVLLNVAPELDEAEVSRSCTQDGRRCTFEGPWPGDDFLVRWVRAIDDGFVSSEDTVGVRFRRFEPVDTEQGRIFRIVAVTEDGP